MFLVVGVDREKSVAPPEAGSRVFGYLRLGAHALGLGSRWINQLGGIAVSRSFGNI
ncbi:MAG: hypothetical protein LBR11_00695 [Deltaproteobacteria bacterium]|nr:hypothetical protein [Deltaproteobacteria bacterium]